MTRKDLLREQRSDVLRLVLDGAMILCVALALHVLQLRLLAILVILLLVATAYAYQQSSRYARLVLHVATPIVLGFLMIELYVALHDPLSAVSTWFSKRMGLDPAAAGLGGRIQFNVAFKEQFYTAIATLFAILVGLALLKGIDGVGRIRENFASEVRDIRALWAFTDYFEDEELQAADRERGKGEASMAAKYALRSNIRAYLGNVRGETGSVAQHQANDKLLAAIQTDIRGLHPADDDDQIARQEIIRLIDRIGAARSRRLAVHGDAPPVYMMLALWLMALAIVVPFLTEPPCRPPVDARPQAQLADQQATGAEARTAVPTPQRSPAQAAPRIHCPQGLEPSDNRFSQYYMIFVLVVAFSFLLLMLHDVTDTRDGFWKVDTEPYEDLLEELEPTAAHAADAR